MTIARAPILLVIREKAMDRTRERLETETFECMNDAVRFIAENGFVPDTGWSYSVECVLDLSNGNPALVTANQFEGMVSDWLDEARIERRAFGGY